MVKYYLNKVQSGTLSLEKVPALWRAKVEAELLENEKGTLT